MNKKSKPTDNNVDPAKNKNGVKESPIDLKNAHIKL